MNYMDFMAFYLCDIWAIWVVWGVCSVGAWAIPASWQHAWTPMTMAWAFVFEFVPSFHLIAFYCNRHVSDCLSLVHSFALTHSFTLGYSHSKSRFSHSIAFSLFWSKQANKQATMHFMCHFIIFNATVSTAIASRLLQSREISFVPLFIS